MMGGTGMPTCVRMRDRAEPAAVPVSAADMQGSASALPHDTQCRGAGIAPAFLSGMRC